MDHLWVTDNMHLLHQAALAQLVQDKVQLMQLLHRASL